MVEIKKNTIVDDYHGTKVIDPYRWLENPDSDETREWNNRMKKEYKEYFAQNHIKENLRKRLEELWNYPKYYVPIKIKGKLFYRKNDGLQEQSVLFCNEKDKELVIFDPNTLSPNGNIAMNYYAISKDGKYLAYALSKDGGDWEEIHIRDLSTGRDLPDKIQYVKSTSIAWLPDSSGFYYSGFSEKKNYHKVFFHEIGYSQETDKLIFEHPEDISLFFSPFISVDNKYLCLYAYLGSATENLFYYRPIDSNEKFFLLNEANAEYVYITNKDNIFYFKTNLDSPNGKIIAFDVKKPFKKYKEIIREQEDVIDFVIEINEKFVIGYLYNGYHQMKVFNSNR